MALPGYAKEIVEKVGRISDVLMEMTREPLLSETLSLYGGTALNLIHIKPIPRLSEDLDFNYRHIGDRDWGDVRDDVDLAIKGILYDLGYQRNDIRIQPRYNIGRFQVHYESAEGLKDSFKIEIGYTRRIPDTLSDARLTFEHPLSGETAKVLTPRSEELFGNKWCTMVARTGKLGYPRDLFDVSNFSKLDYDRSLFIDLVMLEALLSELDLNEMSVVELDTTMVTRLNALLDTRRLDGDETFREVQAFSEDVVAQANDRGWEELMGDFDAYGIVNLDLLKHPGQIHPDFVEHPLLRWILEKRKRRKLSRTEQHDSEK
jgi:predicted nucleotidyltransferase component of viral defense system